MADENNTKMNVQVGVEPVLTNTEQLQKGLSRVFTRSIDDFSERMMLAFNDASATVIAQGFAKKRALSAQAKMQDQMARRQTGLEIRDRNARVDTYRRDVADQVARSLKEATSAEQLQALMQKWSPTQERISNRATNLNMGDWSEEERMAVYKARLEVAGFDAAKRKWESLMRQMEDDSETTSGVISSIFARMFGRIGRFGMDILKRMRTQLIRNIARQLLNLAKEGLQILTNWDREFGNNTSHAAETVDHLSATWYQLKKTIGAAFMPLIQIAMPVIDTIANAVMNLFNLFNMGLRSIQGYSTYMKATYKETKATTSAAKELKKVLFGFDELNILPSDNGSDLSALDYVKTDIPKLKEIFADLDDRNLGEVIADQWVSDWDKAWAETKEGAKEVTENIKKFFSEGWSQVKSKAVEAWGRTKEAASEAWGKLVEIVDSIKTDFAEAWENLKQWGVDTWDRIKERADIFWSGITSAADSAWSFITGIWDKVKTAWDTYITNPIKRKWTQLKIDLLENMPNWMAKLFGIDKNTTLAKLKAELDIQTNTSLSPDTKKIYDIIQAGVKGVQIGSNAGLSVALGVKNGTAFKPISFASGGSIQNKGTLIRVNEAGPEVVANMGNATGIMNTTQMEGAIASGNSVVVQAIYDIAGEVIRAVQDKSLDVYLNADKVGSSVTKYQNNQRRSFGY